MKPINFNGKRSAVEKFQNNKMGFKSKKKRAEKEEVVSPNNHENLVMAFQKCFYFQ